TRGGEDPGLRRHRGPAAARGGGGLGHVTHPALSGPSGLTPEPRSPYFRNMFRKDETAARPGLTLAAVGVVQFLVSLDLSVVNLGLPEIASGLGFGGVDVTWVIHAYALAFGGLLLLGGKLADRHGRRRVLLGGLGLFALASLLGGFAQEQGQLIAARAAQGIGAAALAPAALAILTVSFPSGRARARAFGVWS